MKKIPIEKDPKKFKYDRIVIELFHKDKSVYRARRSIWHSSFNSPRMNTSNSSYQDMYKRAEKAMDLIDTGEIIE